MEQYRRKTWNSDSDSHKEGVRQTVWLVHPRLRQEWDTESLFSFVCRQL